MATRHGVELSDKSIDAHVHEQLGAHRGKWVALAVPSRFLGFGETASKAYAAGQAAGEPKPTIRRVPA